VKERQDSLAARIAGTIAGGVRRRQQEREPRALLYDAGGEPRILPPGSDAHAELIEAAARVVDVALGDAGDADEAGDADPGDAG